MMEGFDPGKLICNHSRIVTDRGVYVCPILIEAPDARLGATLAESLGAYPLRHHACYTCYQYGALCANPSERAARCLSRTRIAVFGGVYNNYLALEAALRDARGRGVDAVYCLGDLGAFGPHPDRVFPLLHDHGVLCIQGNYDNSIGNGLADCQCGYTDPRDNHFARISYDYTFTHTSPANRAWMKELPPQRRIATGPLSAAAVPRQPAAR